MNAALGHPDDLAPYGAAELRTVARTHLARALAAGSGAWLLGFMLAGMLLALFAAEPDVPIVPYGPVHEVMPWKPHTIDPLPSPGGGRKTPRIAGGEVRPVETEIPTAEVSPPAGQGGEVDSGEEGAGPFVQGTPIEAEPEVLPERGTYVPHDTEPLEIFNPKPVYPEMAVMAGMDGRLTVLALIGRDGSVLRAEVLRPVPMLDEAALEAVRRWRFSPALDHGRPVAVWISIPVVFTLH
jgi:protein TonB